MTVSKKVFIKGTSCKGEQNCFVLGTDVNSVTSLSTLLVGPDPVIPSTFVFFNNQVTNQCIEVNGTLIIDSWVNFINCRFTFGPGARLQVASWSSTFSGCTLEGCSQMWRGIWMNSGNWIFNNNLAILDGTTIKDAYKAVLVNDNNNVFVRNADFNLNHYGVVVEYTTPSSIENMILGTSFRHDGTMKPTYLLEQWLRECLVQSGE